MNRTVLTPTHYAEDRLWLGGGLVFCSALVVQLLQIASLSRPLWVALYSCAVAMPLLASSLIVLQLHASFPTAVGTWAAFIQQRVGLMAAYVSAVASVWHFHWAVAATLFASTLVWPVLGDMG